MRLSRMGASFPNRLSFLRTLMRFLARENVRVRRDVWQIDAAGFGHAVYALKFGGHQYSLVAVSTDLPAEARTDRVIATAWDTAYILYDGVPNADEVARIVADAPRQEAARFTERDLILSRANKSVRLFDHVVACLQAGRQPDASVINDTGYLMRTTAVYGNGKFGIADRAVVAGRPGLDGPFMAEMLTVWLIRHFTHDLVEHLGGQPLERRLKRHLGIGNATGLGMAPFLVTHPVLLNNWMRARETALACVRGLDRLSATEAETIGKLGGRVVQHLAEWQVSEPQHQKRIDRLRADWNALLPELVPERLQLQGAMDTLIQGSLGSTVDLQELLAALVLEPFGEIVDDFAAGMGDPHGALVRPMFDTAEIRKQIETCGAWALKPDYATPDASRRFWYVSAAKQEPRLGDRYAEPGADLETPLDIGRRIKALHADLPTLSEPVSDFLARCPQHALAMSRVGAMKAYPYAEIRDNLIGADCLPTDMLRCKLAFFGATKFDPKSDRWTRITLCQGAPLADELSAFDDDWWMPVLEG